MEKIGYRIIKKNRNGGKPAKCYNCGREAFYRVEFDDPWGKLTVSLCERCSKKPYEELKLQSRLDWPVVA